LKNKKILIFSREFPPKMGGMGVVAKQYAEILSNYYLCVLTDYQKYAKNNTNQNYKIINIKTLPKIWFLSYKNAINFDEFDLIILNDPDAAYIAGKYFSNKLLSKSIVFLHGSEPEYIFENPSLSKKLLNFKKYYKNALFRCFKIISVSNYMKEKFLEKTMLKELKNKIYTIYTPINLNEFYKNNEINIYEKHNIPKNAEILLSVSRIIEKKGYLNMFNIFKKLVNKNENLFWIIVGEGNYTDTLKDLIMNNNLKSKILLIGKIPRNELKNYYSNVDLFWLLSNFNESFGLVYIEAQACGCPVIGRNQAGVKEAINDKKSGFLVNTDKECFDIINNKEYLALEKNNIINYSKRFDIKNQLEKIENIILKEVL